MSDIFLCLSTVCKELKEIEHFLAQNSSRRWKSRVKLGAQHKRDQQCDLI